MTREKELLFEYQEFKTPEKVGLSDSQAVEAIGVGNIHVKMKLNVGEPKKCVLYRVLYVRTGISLQSFSLSAAVAVKFSKSNAGFEIQVEICVVQAY